MARWTPRSWTVSILQCLARLAARGQFGQRPVWPEACLARGLFGVPVLSLQFASYLEPSGLGYQGRAARPALSGLPRPAPLSFKLPGPHRHVDAGRGLGLGLQPLEKRHPAKSRLIPGYTSLAILSHLIPGYASLDILSQLILGYPNLRNLYWDIPGYPDLPRVSLFQMSFRVRCRAAWTTIGGPQ